MSGERLTPQALVAKWRGVELSERASVQEHSLDLCALFGHATPAAWVPSAIGWLWAYAGGAPAHPALPVAHQ